MLGDIAATRLVRTLCNSAAVFRCRLHNGKPFALTSLWCVGLFLGACAHHAPPRSEAPAAAPIASTSLAESEPEEQLEHDASPPDSSPDPSPRNDAATAEKEAEDADESDAPPTVALKGISLESVYRNGEMKVPEGRREKKAFLVELEKWNNGGYSDGTKWHAVPRVVIGEPSVRSGKIDAKALMKKLRAEQYMTARHCFDAALRDDPELSGRTVLKLRIKGDRVADATVSRARVSDSRKHPKTMSSKVASCLAEGFRDIAATRPRSGSATVLVSVDLWPGDAPIATPPRAPVGSLSLDSLQRALADAAPSLGKCVASEHGAWGRLALELDIGEDGVIRDAIEVESTFPVREAARCAATELRKLKKVAPESSSGARVIAAFRIAPK
ncbi:MAG: hypothetical protein U0165_15090 [Polyangiaceae bacterium]